MNINLGDLRLRKDYDRTKWLHLTHYGLLVFALILNWYYGLSGFLTFVFSLIGLSVFYYFSYQTVRNLYYTFWTFSTILFLFLSYKLVSTYSLEQGPALFYVYGLALTFLCVELYILFSPIYYPIVNWWEYDFRYRYDLKILLREEEQEWVEVRLTDLRRGAGCVASFDDYEKGKTLELQVNCENDVLFFKARVMSKRQHSVGRPFHYGVRILLNSPQDRDQYNRLIDFWKQRKRRKKQLKFEKVILK